MRRIIRDEAANREYVINDAARDAINAWTQRDEDDFGFSDDDIARIRHLVALIDDAAIGDDDVRNALFALDTAVCELLLESIDACKE